jgi:hypothetical protein
VGKQWFYRELARLAPVQTKQGWEVKQLRDQLGLQKTGKKTAEGWSAHCVDAWCLAHACVGGRTAPDQRRLLCVTPLQWHRRQLHRLEAVQGGKRTPYGGTLSLGLKRGTLVRHPVYGLAYVGGNHGEETQPACAQERQAAHPGGETGRLSADQTPTMEGAAPPSPLDGDGFPTRSC